jgi:hypothetical protein
MKNYTSQPLPYFAAFLQGGDYIINIKVDKRADRADQPDDEAGFIKDIWIKYKSYEWEIDLEYLEVKCDTDSRELFSNHDCWDSRGKKKWWPCKYEIDLPDLTIKMSHHARAISLQRKENFNANNPNIKNYYGAVISEDRLRYLKDLKEVLI